MSRGSHATYGGWEPRTCDICGGPIVLSRNDEPHRYGLRFHYDHATGQARSTHVTCERNTRGELTLENDRPAE